jgi:hypothetical protein
MADKIRIKFSAKYEKTGEKMWITLLSAIELS